jgi:hypothetical protein
MALLGASNKVAWENLLTTDMDGQGNGVSKDYNLDLNTKRSGGTGVGVWPLLLDLCLDLASFTPTTLSVDIYCLPAVDETPTDYVDVSGAYLIWQVPLTSGASRKKNTKHGINLSGIMSRYAKIRVTNTTGAQFAGSGNLLKAKFIIGDESA